jgi:hypothetical protein
MQFSSCVLPEKKARNLRYLFFNLPHRNLERSRDHDGTKHRSLHKLLKAQRTTRISITTIIIENSTTKCLDE